MSLELAPLPYGLDDLAPYMSRETLEFHHGKHHASYVTNLNQMLVGTEAAGWSLEQIIKRSEGPMFNNAAQIWNHDFFWNSIRPGGGGPPEGQIGEAIAFAFGSYEKFRVQFTEAAMTQFGSGWAWLIDDGFGLRIMKTANADLPIVHGAKALLTVDVWEHAYYIDHRNARPAYLDTFMDSLVNWDHAEALLDI